MKTYEKDRETKARKRFLGKKITSVRWMTEKEAEDNGWHSRPIVLIFNDNTWICPMADDEGNDGGAVADGNETWPVF